MNAYLEKLYQSAFVSKRRILGVMSGTSMDGLDMALCLIHNSGTQTEIKVEAFNTFPFSQKYKRFLRSIYSKTNINLEDLCLINEWVGLEFAKIITHQNKIWGYKPEQIDLIASHGQTIYHSPKSKHLNPEFPNGSLQIGDGDHIAQKTGIITLSDFRQKHLAAGGEGAPLAPYGESLLFTHPEKDRILINIGGISNFTYLPGRIKNKQVVSSDLGPGNTLMDGFVRQNYPGNDYDFGGMLAQKGRPNLELLEKLISLPFFSIPIPKSTGPELFNKSLLDSVLGFFTAKYLPEDILATLSELTAQSIFLGISPYLSPETEVYISGGGIHNLNLLERIEKKLAPIKIQSTADLGIHPDAKEAVLFAVLANESLAGNSHEYGMQGIHYPMVSLGKISLPN